MKKGEKISIDIPDGQIITFGKNSAQCDVCLPLEEIDNEQFQIMNYNGQLYIIDSSNEFPTRIKVLTGKKYRLNTSDFINLGLQQDLLI